VSFAPAKIFLFSATDAIFLDFSATSTSALFDASIFRDFEGISLPRHFCRAPRQLPARDIATNRGEWRTGVRQTAQKSAEVEATVRDRFSTSRGPENGDITPAGRLRL
jgi:hypothetical protein